MKTEEELANEQQPQTPFGGASEPLYCLLYVVAKHKQPFKTNYFTVEEAFSAAEKVKNAWGNKLLGYHIEVNQRLAIWVNPNRNANSK